LGTSGRSRRSRIGFVPSTAASTSWIGLTAKYDFLLTYSRDGTRDAETLPTVFGASQSKLGLKLAPKKIPVDVMVIDHMEKTPTAN